LDTFPTSTPEVSLPSSADFILVFPNELQRGGEAALAQAVVDCEFDPRFKPEFRFSFRMVRVDMHARLFALKEEETEPACPEDRGIHSIILH
jgi:hypothetical protein